MPCLNSLGRRWWLTRPWGDGLLFKAVADRVPVLADRLGQRLGAVDDEQAADRRVEAAADQIVEQRLGYGGVLARLSITPSGRFSSAPSMPMAASSIRSSSM